MEREFLTKAVVLCSQDYKEKDKQLTLFTIDSGKITAVLKGVKSPKAKLKFLTNPFCFAEVQIVQKSNFYTLTNATLIDSFFDLSKQIENYYVAGVMLDITQNIVKFNEQNIKIFIELISCLKAICYEKVNAKMALIKFCLTAIENLGYKLSFNYCSRCDMPYKMEKFLDLSSGEFVCQNCKNIHSISVSSLAFNSLKIISQTEISRFNTIKINDIALREIIDFLIEDIECRVEHKISSKNMLKNI